MVTHRPHRRSARLLLGVEEGADGTRRIGGVRGLVDEVAAGFGVILLCIGVVFTMFWAICVAGYAFAQVYRTSTVKFR